MKLAERFVHEPDLEESIESAEEGVSWNDPLLAIRREERYVTCLQLEMNTIILLFKCVLMKLNKTSNFLSNSTTEKCCSRFLGVTQAPSPSSSFFFSAALTGTGELRDSRARSLTDFVWVAEKRRV